MAVKRIRASRRSRESLSELHKRVGDHADRLVNSTRVADEPVLVVYQGAQASIYYAGELPPPAPRQ